jgi:hypothetical protein
MTSLPAAPALAELVKKIQATDNDKKTATVKVADACRQKHSKTATALRRFMLRWLTPINAGSPGSA